MAPTTTPTEPGSGDARVGGRGRVDDRLRDGASVRDGALHARALGVRRGGEDEHPAAVRRGEVKQRVEANRIRGRAMR